MAAILARCLGQSVRVIKDFTGKDGKPFYGVCTYQGVSPCGNYAVIRSDRQEHYMAFTSLEWL